MEFNFAEGTERTEGTEGIESKVKFGNASENGQSFLSKTVGSLIEDRYRLGHWWVQFIS